MKFCSTCVLIIESVRHSVGVDKFTAGNGGKAGVVSSSTDFEDIPIHEYSERRAEVQPTFLKRRSGIVETPPWIGDESQSSFDPSRLMPAIELEKYCESIDEIEKVETLFVLDEQVNRPGGYCWKVLGLISKDGGIKINRPRYVRVIPTQLDHQVQPRTYVARIFSIAIGIQVPLARGKHGFRMVQLLTVSAEEPIKRDVLECACEIKDAEAYTHISVFKGTLSVCQGVWGGISLSLSTGSIL